MIASQAKTDFLSNMSHELRTPLNGILGYAQILKRDRGLDAHQADRVDIIYQSGHHLLTLINDVLDLSKIEARKMELYPAPIGFIPFLESIAAVIRMGAQQKNIRFVSEFDSQLPAGVLTDEKRLRQVLINLLGNAVKFTDRGQVLFRVYCPQGEAKTSAAGTDVTLIRFEVTDTGVGMTAAQLEKIFLPFEQVGDVHQREDGTGLGLAISRQLVELMGGQIEVESQKDLGSAFWFEVSLTLMEIAAKDEQTVSLDIVGYSGRRRLVLVVDDKASNRNLMQAMLEPLGFEVSLAENGVQAIEEARRLQPDMILMDLIMPMKTGFEAVQEIRQMPDLQKMPIIAISASSFDTDETESRVVGCDAFLPKPIDADKLLALFEDLLKLEWVYAQPSEEEARNGQVLADGTEESVVLPPVESLEELYELALLGKMRRIEEWATAIAEYDEKYTPFVKKIQALAKAFEDKQIVTLVKELMETDDGEDS